MIAPTPSPRRVLLDEPVLWYPIGTDATRDLIRERRERDDRWRESPANICADMGHLFVWGSAYGKRWWWDCLRCGEPNPGRPT